MRTRLAASSGAVLLLAAAGIAASTQASAGVLPPKTSFTVVTSFVDQPSEIIDATGPWSDCTGVLDLSNEVNQVSPTGYPMRMLKGSPGIGAGIRPNCEAYGYLLDAKGNCAYIDAYNREVALHPDAKKISVKDKTCLCTHMRNFDIWTCGQTTYRLKDTTRRLPDGSYQVLSAEHVFHDYQFSTDQKILLPG